MKTDSSARDHAPNTSAATEKEPLPQDVVGFTGSRSGLTKHQSTSLARELLPVREFHHGDCIGSDGMAHVLARAAGCRIVTHPTGGRYRAYCLADETREVKAPLDRNQDIVCQTQRLIACPAGFAEEQRSGTWATVRRARKVGREVAIIWPDGSVARERERHSSPPSSERESSRDEPLLPSPLEDCE